MMSPRVFLVTGAASGIGRALAEAIAGRGERVLASDRELAPLRSLAGRWPSPITSRSHRWT
ncbi:MAG: SDR family NAD(P)-dependent oxidoreductase [Nannocystaceae bacterium]